MDAGRAFTRGSVPEEPQLTRPATGSILVIDDDRVNRTLLARALELEGHDVRLAENGSVGLQLLAAQRADVVLLDVIMPGLDGMTVLQMMRDDSLLHDVPVIMVSALDDYQSVIRCIELGAEDYLPKPFDPVLLRARVNAALNKARLHDLERARVRDVFTRFLPEPMVDEVMTNGGALSLGGVRRVGSVLFSDIRGFTTFAEAKSPDVVVNVLNRYLTEMSDAVLDNGGTLVAFRGDGIVAVFGAPIESADHADRAVAVARDMVTTRLPRFNDWLRADGHGDGFRIGIGVASGPFMSGNIGSERRLEYSAIGDTVNTAARIESLTKDLSRPVLLDEATWRLLTAPVDDFEFVDEVDVRGRRARIKLWGLAAAV
jgi:adenylate cyclase